MDIDVESAYRRYGHMVLRRCLTMLNDEHQIAMLWHAIEKLSARSREIPSEDCVPQDAHTTEQFDAEKLNRLVK